jgi:hypothetical protein
LLPVAEGQYPKRGTLQIVGFHHAAPFPLPEDRTRRGDLCSCDRCATRAPVAWMTWSLRSWIVFPICNGTTNLGVTG